MSKRQQQFAVVKALVENPSCITIINTTRVTQQAEECIPQTLDKSFTSNTLGRTLAFVYAVVCILEHEIYLEDEKRKNKQNTNASKPNNQTVQQNPEQDISLSIAKDYSMDDLSNPNLPEFIQEEIKTIHHLIKFRYLQSSFYSQSVTPQSATSQSTTSQSATSQSATSQSVTPQYVTPQSATSQSVTPQYVTRPSNSTSFSTSLQSYLLMNKDYEKIESTLDSISFDRLPFITVYRNGSNIHLCDVHLHFISQCLSCADIVPYNTNSKLQQKQAQVLFTYPTLTEYGIKQAERIGLKHIGIYDAVLCSQTKKELEAAVSIIDPKFSEVERLVRRAWRVYKAYDHIHQLAKQIMGKENITTFSLNSSKHPLADDIRKRLLFLLDTIRKEENALPNANLDMYENQLKAICSLFTTYETISLLTKEETNVIQIWMSKEKISYTFDNDHVTIRTIRGLYPLVISFIPEKKVFMISNVTGNEAPIRIKTLLQDERLGARFDLTYFKLQQQVNQDEMSSNPTVVKPETASDVWMKEIAPVMEKLIVSDLFKKKVSESKEMMVRFTVGIVLSSVLVDQLWKQLDPTSAKNKSLTPVSYGDMIEVLYKNKKAHVLAEHRSSEKDDSMFPQPSFLSRNILSCSDMNDTNENTIATNTFFNTFPEDGLAKLNNVLNNINPQQNKKQ